MKSSSNLSSYGWGLFTVFIISLNAKAEEAIEETLVWGTEVVSNSLFLGESDIAIKQADHLSDLLRDIPGVDIGGTHSVNARMNFRGLDDRDLAVYIDGALQTNYLYHHMGNLLINSDILARAEIELGANSVAYSGLGGAVRFRTKDASDLLRDGSRDFGARFMLGYHSNAQQSYSITSYGQTEHIDGLAYFHSVNRDNFEDGEGVQTIGSDGSTDNYLLKIGSGVAEGHRLELSYEKVSDSGDYTQRPDMGVRTNEAITGDLLLPTEYERDTINLGYEFDLGEVLNGRITLFNNGLKLWRDERATITRAGPGTLKEAEADNQGLNVLVVSNLGQQHTLTYGLEYFEQNLDYRPNLELDIPVVKERGTSTAFFIEDRIQLGSFALTPGVRWSDFEKDIELTGSSGSWDDTSFSLAAEYQIVDTLTISAAYTELFKAPELAEVFIGGASNKIINPDVEPETGDNVELGLRYSRSIGGTDLNLGFKLFETTIENYVAEAAVGDDSGNEWDVNVGTAVINGGEASFQVNFDKHAYLLTYAKSDLDADRMEIDDTTESLREIGDSLNFEASFNPLSNLDLIYGLRHTMEKDTVNRQVKPSYTVHNVSANWRVTKELNILAGVDNLFDENYTSHASRTGEVFHPVFGELFLDDVEPGRNIKLTVSYTL